MEDNLLLNNDKKLIICIVLPNLMHKFIAKYRFSRICDMRVL